MDQQQLRNLIDVPLWNRAGWKGVAYLVMPGNPPGLALVFQNPDIGEQVITGLGSIIGPIDRDDLLRIAIIEGDLPGHPPGYSIHLSPNPEQMVVPPSGVVYPTKVHRMPQSPYLAGFKTAFAEAGRYYLTVAKIGPGGQILFDRVNAIEKRQLVFRDTASITAQNDIDGAIRLHPGDDSHGKGSAVH